MKIDFDATYRDIARITGSSDKRVYSRKGLNGFSRLLGSIAPDRPQPAETKDLLEKVAEKARAAPSEDLGPMASFKFSSPELMTPPLEPLNKPGLIQESVTDPAAGVKTPALLGLRRVPARDTGASAARSNTDRVPQVKAMVNAAGRIHGVDPSLGLSVISVESDFDPQALSRDGHKSKGLFQLLDSTGKDMLKRLGVENGYNPYNPEQNINLGLGYLRYLHDIFSQPTELSNQAKTVAAANSSSLEKLAVAAFNAGEGRVAAAQGQAAQAGRDPQQYEHVAPYLPDSTKQYVDRVMSRKGGYEGPAIG